MWLKDETKPEILSKCIKIQGFFIYTWVAADEDEAPFSVANPEDVEAPPWKEKAQWFSQTRLC